MAAVFGLAIPASEKLVLLAMADHARDDGTGCYPSVDLLARKTSQSRRGVQKIMRRLEEERGLIAPSHLSRGGRRATTEYTLVLENREPGSLFSRSNREPGAAKPRTGFPRTANLVPRNRERGSPEPSGTVSEPSERTGAQAVPLGRQITAPGLLAALPTDFHSDPLDEGLMRCVSCGAGVTFSRAAISTHRRSCAARCVAAATKRAMPP
jgi:Helix-turn-helix domain